LTHFQNCGNENMKRQHSTYAISFGCRQFPTNSYHNLWALQHIIYQNEEKSQLRPIWR
jgi:hypothetical protein